MAGSVDLQAQVENLSKEMLPEISIAIKEEKLEIIDELLTELSNLPIDLGNQIDAALFYVACISGTVDLLKKFTDYGFPIDRPMKTIPESLPDLQKYLGYTGLHLAFKYHRLGAVQFLLNRGASLFTPDNQGTTPLHALFESKKQAIQKQNSLESYNQVISIILQSAKHKTHKIANNEMSHFHIACTRDVPETIQNFLHNGASIDQTVGAFPGHEGFLPLHLAAKYNCHKVVEFLLENGSKISSVDQNNQTALHLTDSTEVAGLLLQNGADFFLQDSNGNTPLHTAFERRNYEVMDLLLSAHIISHSNPVNASGISHFHIACARNEEIVKHFLKNNVPVNDCVPIDPEIEYTNYWEDLDWRGCSPLHFAVAFNMSEIVKLLLSLNADVETQDARGFTPLHLACRSMLEKVEDFVDKNLQNIRDQNVTGNDWINWLSNRKEHIDTIELLLKYESDVMCHDNFDCTPVSCAYVYYALNDGRFLEKYQKPVRDCILWEMRTRRKIILGILLQHPIDLDTCYYNGSILHYVMKEAEISISYSGDEELAILEMFLRKGATVNVFNQDGMTPYEACKKTARRDFEELLVKYGANVDFHKPKAELENYYEDEQMVYNKIFESGTDAKNLGPALHYLAGKSSHYPIVFEKLMEAGVDINACNAKGQTPLFGACLSFNDELVETLLLHGANINIEDNKGKSVLCVLYEEKMKDEKFDEKSPFKEKLSRVSNLLLHHIRNKRAGKEEVSQKVLQSREKVINFCLSNLLI